MPIEKEQLEYLYVERGLSSRACAKALGIRQSVQILIALKKFGIKARSVGFQKGNRSPGDRKPETHGSWKGGKQTVLCDTCGSKLFRFPSHVHDKNFCNKDCYGDWKKENFKGESNPNHGSVAMIGPGNPNWRGGINCEPYCDVWNDVEYKYDIKLRDGNECQNPDCRKTSTQLCLHHINYNKKDCHPKNLITLCNSCNVRANYNRDFWEAGYTAIIEAKYRLYNIKKVA